MPESMAFHIAGVKFREGAHARLLALPAGTPLTLEPEEGNQYDPNAVKILDDGFQVGYVPAFLSARVRAAIAEGRVESLIYDGDKGVTLVLGPAGDDAVSPV